MLEFILEILVKVICEVLDMKTIIILFFFMIFVNLIGKTRVFTQTNII